MAAFYFLAGINHFSKPQFYLNLFPSWFPAPVLMNQLSGVAEIILAIGLIPVATRYISASLIIAMLVVFLVIHISHIFQPPASFGKNGLLMAFARLPFQFLFIYWAWKVGGYH